MENQKFTSVEQYLDTFPVEIRSKLEQLRTIIKKAAPRAQEVISYNMPAYKQHSVLVYFAGNKGHIGFYPTASPIVVFAEALKAYKTSKGAIQCPMDQPIPRKLVNDIVKHRIAEDQARAAARNQNTK